VGEGFNQKKLPDVVEDDHDKGLNMIEQVTRENATLATKKMRAEPTQK
jgi:hypothetical protein